MTELGKLVDVDIRQAWSHEARDFTPWLASHLGEIGETIGLPLELEGQEVAVDTYSADILARNPHNDARVLIENQLESSDHCHLGQIMTYLAGLEAETVIWIATRFTEAHLSAIKWLNEHTEQPFAFFAVKVRVVRIGESPIAPIFEVLERPNDWERQLHEKTRAQPDSLMKKKQEFWDFYFDRFPAEAQSDSLAGRSNRWRRVPDYGLVVSYYVAAKGVGLFLRGTLGANNDDVAELLTPHRERLQEMTGSQHWNAPSGFFFHVVHPGDVFDENHWSETADWLQGMVKRYEEAVRQCFGGQQ